MFRNLYADTRSILFSRSFRFAMIAIVISQVFYFSYVKALYIIFVESQLDADEIAFSFHSIAAFLVTAATLFVTDREFSNGCIRNKIISGVKRFDVFLSAVFTGALQGAIYSMFACLISVVFTCIFTIGFVGYSIPEAADYWLVITMSCMAIGAFSTALVMMLGGNKASYVVGLLLAFAMKLADTHIFEKLYPEKGYCTLTGMKLAVYSFVDRFIPYSYLMMRPHYNMGFYVAGCSGMVLISVIIGLIIFNKKELR